MKIGIYCEIEMPWRFYFTVIKQMAAVTGETGLKYKTMIM